MSTRPQSGPVSEISAQANPPTVRELAAELGLHHATVARALGNQPNVTAATRERVLAAAKARGGYRANALVNALMAQVRRHHRLKPTGEVVAFLTGFESEGRWRELPSHVAQFEGAKLRASKLGFSLQPMWMGERGAQARQLGRVLAARGVRGALLAPPPSGENENEAQKWAGEWEGYWEKHVFVAIGYGWRWMRLHRAVHDSVGLASECCARLHGAACRRVGLAIPEQYGARGRHLLVNGYLGACWFHELAAVPPLLLTGTNDAGDEAAFVRWFDRHRLDAVIGMWPDKPLRWLRKQGLQVPRKACYATLDLGDRRGQLAGMEQDNHTIGAAAMDLLASQLFLNEMGSPQTPTVTLVDGTWRDGPTVRRGT
ncbi:LacI family transcriptional regulator [Opitutaceae bacterium TAV4]|nr:LacI family transcriptional regulator [Opitutaceae bacterium TAV4]RRK01034.1 LacI family transcriptional regulator [Opitutaceae bacterium TAV3]